jgi:hypothetical protein
LQELVVCRPLSGIGRWDEASCAELRKTPEDTGLQVTHVIVDLFGLLGVVRVGTVSIQIDYRVEHDGSAIGVLPQDNIPAEGEFLLLAGRRWKVTTIDHASKRVAVSPAKGWKQPRSLWQTR